IRAGQEQPVPRSDAADRAPLPRTGIGDPAAARRGLTAPTHGGVSHQVARPLHGARRLPLQPRVGSLPPHAPTATTGSVVLDPVPACPAIRGSGPVRAGSHM